MNIQKAFETFKNKIGFIRSPNFYLICLNANAQAESLWLNSCVFNKDQIIRSLQWALVKDYKMPEDILNDPNLRICYNFTTKEILFQNYLVTANTDNIKLLTPLSLVMTDKIKNETRTVKLKEL